MSFSLAPTAAGDRIAFYPPASAIAAAASPSVTPLIAVAGGPGADHRYLRIGGGFDRIGTMRRLVFYDQRGTSRSSPAGDDVSVDSFVEDLDAVRQALGVEQIDLIGHSFGAYLAMAYAAKQGARVRSLVLASAMASTPGETVQLLDAVFPDRVAEWRRIRAALPERFLASDIAIFHTMEFVDPAAHAHYAHDVAEHAYNMRINDLLRADMARIDFSGALRALDKPALVIHGRFDAVLAPAIAWNLYRLMPRSRLHMLEQSGHMPFIEQPEAFAGAVISFLTDVDAGRV